MKIWKIDSICAVDDNTYTLLEACLNEHEKVGHNIKEIIQEKPGNFKIIYTIEEQLQDNDTPFDTNLKTKIGSDICKSCKNSYYSVHGYGLDCEYYREHKCDPATTTYYEESDIRFYR